MRKFTITLALLGFSFLSCITVAAPSQSSAPKNFEAAKRVLENRIYNTTEKRVDFYCGCSYWANKKIDKNSCGYIPRNPKSSRSKSIEFEHIVPADAFVNAFQKEIALCPKWKSKRECTRKNPIFNLMESDMNNLVPAVGEVNNLRSNYSYAELDRSNTKWFESFGRCGSVLDTKANKFEPKNISKWWAARVYLYMDETYPGHWVVSGKNKKLFEAWSIMYPVTARECTKAKSVVDNGWKTNRFQKESCTKRWLWK